MSNHTKIVTLSNGYHVWTRCVGNGPVKILLIPGGPGMTHEYLSPFTKFIHNKPIQIIYYDPLGCYFSDQPDDSSLWSIDRICREIDQVRQAWHLNQFYLYGQSCGGLLAMEYAVRPRYQTHLKGLIDSNMVSDVHSYFKYLREYRDRTLSSGDVRYMHHDEQIGQDDKDPKYAQLCLKFYHHCICRLKPWPIDVQNSLNRLSLPIYTRMWGTREFSMQGTLKNWSITKRLHLIHVPTLVLGGKYDSMNPKNLKMIAHLIPRAKFHLCPKGSHLSLWDDSKNYFKAIYNYIRQTDGYNLKQNVK